MATYRLELYVSSADQAATETILNTVMGAVCPMTTQGSNRYVGLIMSDAQLVAFKTAITAILSAKWYQCTNQEYYSRQLIDTNIVAAYANKGVKWTWRNNEQANAGSTIAARRDIAYVAPDGLSTNAGDIENPLDLRSALIQSPIAAPVVYLRAGTHDLTADTTISAAIEIRNYAGEDVFIRIVSPEAPTVIQLAVSNGNTFFEANSAGGLFRIGSEPTTRLRSERFDYPDMGRVDCLGNGHPDGTFRGLFFHDLLTITYQSGTGGTLFKDCVLWNFGYRWSEAENDSDGEFMYLQNSGAEEKHVENVILAQNYGLSSQIYGQGSGINDIALNKIILLNKRALWASSASPIQNLKLENSLLLHGNVLFGAGSEDNGNVTIRDNYLVARSESMIIGKWASGDIENNVIVALGNNLLACNVASSAVNYDNNSYYNPNNRSISNGTSKTFAQWQGEGRDTHSSHVVANPSNYTRVNACSSGKLKAFIGVSNMESLNTVSVDVSSLGLVNGSTYRLRQAYDPLIDTSEFVYDGSGAINVSFVGRSIAIPIGDDIALDTLVATKGAWVLEAL
jgi:hypothetical protein